MGAVTCTWKRGTELRPSMSVSVVSRLDSDFKSPTRTGDATNTVLITSSYVASRTGCVVSMLPAKDRPLVRTVEASYLPFRLLHCTEPFLSSLCT